MEKKTDSYHPDLCDFIEGATFLLDQEGRIVAANARSEQAWGRNAESLVGQDFSNLFVDDQKKIIAKSVNRTFNDEQVAIWAAPTDFPDQEERTLLVRFAPFQQPGREESLILAGIIDVPEKRSLEQEIDQLKTRTRQLGELVITCPVTGIYNRRYFEARYEEEKARADRYGHSLGLAIVDLDRFKEVNDLHGHQAGDIVLKAAAQVLRNSVRACDVVARYGGDEFVVILPEVSPQGIVPMAIRVRQDVQNKRIKTSSGKNLKITVSIGLACHSPEEASETFESHLRRADESLLQAKRAGGNRFVLHGHNLE